MASRIIALLALATLALPLGLTARPALGAPFTYIVTMSGAQVVPPSQTAAGGLAQLIHETETNEIRFSFLLFGIAAGDVGTVEFRQGPLGTNGALVQALSSGELQATGRFSMTPAEVTLLQAGGYYVEVRSKAGAPVARGQVLPPGVPGIVPTIAIPIPTATTAPAPTVSQSVQSQTQAQSQTTAGAIRPPNTGDAGIR